MTMSNHISENGGKENEKSESYSNIDSPIIPDKSKVKNEELNLKLVI